MPALSGLWNPKLMAAAASGEPGGGFTVVTTNAMAVQQPGRNFAPGSWEPRRNVRVHKAARAWASLPAPPPCSGPIRQPVLPISSSATVKGLAMIEEDRTGRR